MLRAFAAGSVASPPQPQVDETTLLKRENLAAQETRIVMPSRVSCCCAHGEPALGKMEPGALGALMIARYFSPCSAFTISFVSGTVGMSYCLTHLTVPSLSMTTTARAVMPLSPR